MVLKLDYVEFQTTGLSQSKRFLSEAFGWTFTDYGPGYASFDNAGVDGGLEAVDGVILPPLVVLKAGDIAAAQASVIAAGGIIVKEIFDFPGGRRFHFKEPGGNELAVWAEK